MKRAAFLDRDGVINRKAPEGQYVTCWEDMQFLPDVARGIASLNRAGFLVIVVSNQRCVAKGLLTIPALELLHRRMCEHLGASGAVIDGIYYCPHEEHRRCNCRKPAPGMLVTAARDHNIDLHASWMIGDSISDIEAGNSVGCKTARIFCEQATTGSSDISAESLLDAVTQILQVEPSPVSEARQQSGYREPRIRAPLRG